jgi:acyl-CoA thioesterase FadM
MFIHECQVLLEWLDLNGHMNARRYVEAFMDASDRVSIALGLNEEVYATGGHSIFTGDFHVTFVRELLPGRSLRIESRVLELDARRYVLHHEMSDVEDGFLAATANEVQLNVGLGSRRVEPFAREVFDRLAAARAADVDAPAARNVARAAALAAGSPARR